MGVSDCSGAAVGEVEGVERVVEGCAFEVELAVGEGDRQGRSVGGFVGGGVEAFA